MEKVNRFLIHRRQVFYAVTICLLFVVTSVTTNMYVLLTRLTLTFIKIEI